MSKTYHWTDEEDSIIRNLHGTLKNRELAEILKRKTGAVCARASRLGVTKQKQKKWSNGDISILREQYGRIDNDKIAISLDRTKEAVMNRVYLLKLKTRKKIAEMDRLQVILDGKNQEDTFSSLLIFT